MSFFLSVVPSWVFALLGIGAVLMARAYLGKTLATYAAVGAILVVGADAIGDARERWVRAEWAEASRRAEQAAVARDRSQAEAAARQEQAHAASEAQADQKIEEITHAYELELAARASDARRLSAEDVKRLKQIDAAGGAK